ncbi:MAG: DNA-directed RNA polymerase subunit beta' [Anaerolineae bacterium]|nr:DNA-directed RNA polymerase subunit beta' [Anaerolineae bacterium]
MENNDFRAIQISLASPETIHSWSYGEVTKPETINYRRLRPEKDGLFCEAIFGPTKDWQCYCGKYKNVRYKGVVCDKCGVEVTRSAVRRERMGHIDLVAPVAHIWYTRRVPSYLGLLLDISRRNLDRVLYFAQYATTHVDEDARQRALKRLKDEFDREKERLEAGVQEKMGVIEGDLTSQMSEVTGELLTTRQRLDERLAEQTEAIMGEAKMLSASLENQMGRPAREDLVFSVSDQAIVEEGQIITREHNSLLNEIVQDQLSRVQQEAGDERENAVNRLDAINVDIRGAVSEQKGGIQQDYAGKLAALEAQYEADVDELKSLAPMQFLGEAAYRELKSKWGNVFRAGMGAEAFYEYLQGMDLAALSEQLWNEVRTSRSKQRRQRATKRLGVVEALRKSSNRPEWMILTVLPVIPPDLRPMVQLDGGRFATSDLNDLYRRVINRNNRLKRLLDLGAPDVIVRNEKRMLQEAVDSLIDNSRRGKALSRRGRRELKSLSDMLKGKKGRFRRNLLGKRVDYSGRSVIVIGPKLKMHQCGLPKTMALELFRPFVIAKLVEYNYANNVKGARRIIERERPEVWEVLEEVIRARPVLLNRAPTLHRLGIQAFEPLLVEGKAIQLHPLVCSAFNADFDGDQMAVHVPLSERAVQEARELMLSTRNLLKPADGEPIVGPQKDMVLGCYYLTMARDGMKGEGMAFATMDEVSLAYDLGKANIHARIKLLSWTQDMADSVGGPIDTTVGRALFNEILPEPLRFVNEVQDKSSLKELIALAYHTLGQQETADLADGIKDIGFLYATRSGASIAVSDLTVPDEKETILADTSEQVSEVERQYRRGLLTEDEQYTRTIELWTDARDAVSEAVHEAMDPEGPVYVMARSGSTKGGFVPIAQLAGMRGLMADPSGRIIALPIRSSFREGLTALEYFISTHGARKGLADTALRTADAGYLTRRLVDVAQDMIINAEDCGTRAGLWIRASDNAFDPNLPQLGERIVGRPLAGPVIDPRTGEVLLERGHLLDAEAVTRIEEAGVQEAFIRSPFTCQLGLGLCQKCYGLDLGRGELVQLGSAVGIVAAQSIGEPGTQLTLRTFHTGGIAHGGDITHGLPRVEELLEARKHPKGEAIMADISGHVEVRRSDDGIRTVKLINSRLVRDEYPLKRGWKLILEEEQEDAKSGEVIATRGDKEIVVKTGGRIVRGEDAVTIVYDEREEREYEIPSSARLLVSEGRVVEAGDQITEGSKNPHTILSVLGREATQLYMLQEVQKVYRSQGVTIHDKHFEVIISKMLSRVQVMRCGDTELLPGDLVDRRTFTEINSRVVSEGGTPASAKPILLGVTKAALSTDSFLSAASFQHTIRVLAGAAIEGKRDELRGLKENVIIGKLIPAGTGFWKSQAEALPELGTQESLAAVLETELGAGEALDLEDLDLSTEGLEEELEEHILSLGGLDPDDDDDDDEDGDGLEGEDLDDLDLLTEDSELPDAD